MSLESPGIFWVIKKILCALYHCVLNGDRDRIICAILAAVFHTDYPVHSSVMYNAIQIENGFLSDQPSIRECIGREAEFQRDAKTTTSSSCGVDGRAAGGGDEGILAGD